MGSSVELWNARAGMPLTKDWIAKKLEVKTILRYIERYAPKTVVDIGCGDGETARAIAKDYPCHVIGIDFSPLMIEVAEERMLMAGPLKGGCEFRVGNVLDGCPDADLVLTERCLINLPDWATQLRAIQKLAVTARRLLLLENCQDGLYTLNALRGRVGLQPIVPPEHNQYLVTARVMEALPGREPDLHNYSDTYYFLSRVVNAAMALPLEPDYGAFVNCLALDLPSIGNGCGQGRIWFWDLTGGQ